MDRKAIAQGMARKPIILGCVFAVLGLILMVASCTIMNGGNVAGKWHFTSIVPSDAAMAKLDDAEKKNMSDEASILAVFMEDSELDFAENGKVSVKFLGNEYTGVWERTDKGIHVSMKDDDYASASGTYKPEGNELVFESDSSSNRLSGYVVTYERGAYQKSSSSVSSSSSVAK